MATDWRDSLKSLMTEMPQDPAPNEPSAEESPAMGTQQKKAILSIEVDRKRKGKIATIIYGFSSEDSEIEELAATLKKRLATGGSVRDGEILVQGDRASQARTILKELGYKIK